MMQKSNFKEFETSGSTLASGFHLRSAFLGQDDMDWLVQKCKTHFSRDDAIPSYVFIDEIKSTTIKKIHSAVEQVAGCPVHYLNDFYLFTEGTAQANWHVDTEMFTFGRAFNAWILLSPDQVPSPLAMMTKVNDEADNYFHTVKFSEDGNQANFVNMKTTSQLKLSAEDVEGCTVDAPSVNVGDILIFNPACFHRTNISSPKHIVAFKFVAQNDSTGDFKSAMQVPSLLWPETKIFNNALEATKNWDGVLEKVRNALATPNGRKALSAGFFPERIDLFRSKVGEL